MAQQITAWLNAHGVHIAVGTVSAILGILATYFGPGLKTYISGTGPDQLVKISLDEFKAVMKKAGASDGEIGTIENVVAQIAQRAAQNIQKDAVQK